MRRVSYYSSSASGEYRHGNKIRSSGEVVILVQGEREGVCGRETGGDGMETTEGQSLEVLGRLEASTWAAGREVISLSYVLLRRRETPSRNLIVI
jgi:hypothetical protein